MAREGFNPLVLPNKFEPSHHGFKRQGLCRWRCGDLRGGWVPKGPHVSRYQAAATGMLRFECTLKSNGRVQVMVLWYSYGGCKPGK